MSNNPVGLTVEEQRTEWGAAPAPDHEKPRMKVQGCVGCGGLPHGSAQAELNCLKASVVALQQRLRLHEPASPLLRRHRWR